MCVKKYESIKREVTSKLWYNGFTAKHQPKKEVLLGSVITKGAKKRQAVVKPANRKGKGFASRKYGVSLSSVKRRCKRYDGTWKSIAEKSHRRGIMARWNAVTEMTKVYGTV